MKGSIKIISITILAFISLVITLSLKEGINNQSRVQNTEVLVVFSTSDSEIEFWHTLRAGIELAAKRFNVDITITAPEYENDIKGQIAILEAGLLQKPDAIVLAPVDYDALVPMAEKIRDMDIKLMIIDSGLNSDVPDSFITTDNAEAGKKAVNALSEEIGADANIIIMSYLQFSPTAIEREKGVRQGLSIHNDLHITGTYYCGATKKNAYQTAVEILSEGQDLDGIICLNEMTTLGVAEAIKDLDYAGQVKLVGFDSSLAEIKLIEEEVIDATVVQKPFNMGYLSIESVVKSLNNHKVEHRINTGSQVVTKENMYSEENQKLLFPFVSE